MKRLVVAVAVVVVVALGGLLVRFPESLLNSLVYFPSGPGGVSPGAVGLVHEDISFQTADDETLHAWWVPTTTEPVRGHVLLFHGNAGTISDRVIHARLLFDRGFDVFLFDYRGYGRSSGKPSEEGTYADARAAREALLAREGVDPNRLLYVGESLGGAVAVGLAVESPPWGLVLQSSFTSIREMRRVHYPFLPGSIVPDAYNSLERIRGLAAPLLVIHGEQDEIVPVDHGRRLYEAAPEPRVLEILPNVGHNDLITFSGDRWADAIASWAGTLPGAGAGPE